MKRLTKEKLEEIKKIYHMSGKDIEGYRVEDGSVFNKNTIVEELVKEIEACWEEVGNSC